MAHKTPKPRPQSELWEHPWYPVLSMAVIAVLFGLAGLLTGGSWLSQSWAAVARFGEDVFGFGCQITARAVAACVQLRVAFGVKTRLLGCRCRSPQASRL